LRSLYQAKFGEEEAIGPIWEERLDLGFPFFEIAVAIFRERAREAY
jgi:hypothetical protein